MFKLQMDQRIQLVSLGVPHPPVKAKLETAILGCHGDQVLLTSSEESRCGCLHKVILNAGEPVTSHTTFSLEAAILPVCLFGVHVCLVELFIAT